MKSFIKSLAVGVGISAVALGALSYFQESILYHPTIGAFPKETSRNPPPYNSPSQFEVDFEEKYERMDDGVLIHTWLLKAKRSSSTTGPLPTIVFFHGNAGSK